MKYLYFALLVVILISCNSTNESENTPEKSKTSTVEMPQWQSFFEAENVIGATVIYDIQSDSQWIYNLERANTGFLPASTFKIINSMIGLETGAVTLTETLKWNGEDTWNDNWKRDHVLKTAFEVSCVPCYQEIARRVGVEQMKKYTSLSNYGHLAIDSTTIDNFWLTGESEISSIEQVHFITQLYLETLPFSKETFSAIKEIMINETSEDYTIRAKTGWSQSETINNGWFVGYLITSDDAVYVFATNIEQSREVDSKGFAKARIEITKKALQDLGLI